MPTWVDEMFRPNRPSGRAAAPNVAQAVRKKIVEFRELLREGPCDGEVVKGALDELVRLEAALDEPPTVALLGAFKAGKSSVVNALLGATRQDRVAPVDPRPTTCRPVEYQQGASHRVRVFREGEWSEIPPAFLAKLADHNQRDPAIDAWAQEIKRVRVEHPQAVLKDIVLIDTPGFGSGNKDDDNKAVKVAADAAAVIWVMDINLGTVHASELEQVRAARRPDRRMILLLNKADTKPPNDRDQIVANLRRQHGKLFEQVYLFAADPGRDPGAGREAVLTVAGLNAELEPVRTQAAEVRARQVEVWLQGVFSAVAEVLAKDVVEGTKLKEALEATAQMLAEVAYQEAERVGKAVCSTFESGAKKMFRDAAPAFRRIVTVNGGVFWDDDPVVHQSAISDVARQMLEATLPLAQSVREKVEAGFWAMEKRFATELEKFEIGPDLARETLLVLEANRAHSYTVQAIVESFLDGCYHTLAVLLSGLPATFLKEHAATPASAAAFLDEIVADEEVLARLRWFCFYDRDATSLHKRFRSNEDIPLLLLYFQSGVQPISDFALGMVDVIVKYQNQAEKLKQLAQSAKSTPTVSGSTSR